MTKGVDERIDEGVLRWFGHVERMKDDMIAKSVYVEEYIGSHSVGRPRKRRNDTMKDCLMKRDMDVRHARKMGHEWMAGFMRRNAWGVARVMNP